MTKRGWIFISGLLWLLVGTLLLYKGIGFMAIASHSSLSLALALFIGFAKGRWVLPKSANRVVSHILSLPTPIDWKKVYPPAYWILIGSMVLIGGLMRFLPLDIRGFIDVAIGSALIQGSLFYFRAFSRVTSS